MIVDASVAFKWFFSEADSDRAFGLIGSEPLAAPSLIHIEIGNAIWKKHRKRELAGDPRSIDLDMLDQLLTIVPHQPLTARALDFAVMLDHPIYDCVYLALAELSGEALATADKKFAGKVAHAGVATRLELFA